MHGWLRLLLLLLAVLLIFITKIRAYFLWLYDFGLNHVSGTWIALAADLNEGIFYRPLLDENGYGGTFYFPLHFVLQAGLMKLGVGARRSGYALDGLAMVALLLGVYSLLRKLRADRMLAACSAVFVIAARSAQAAVLGVRGDGLPAALNILGLALCASDTDDRRRTYAAAGLFTLAWAAKITTVFGLAAVCFCFLLSGRSKLAWRLAGLTATGFAVVLGVMYGASSGRVFEIMRASTWGVTTPWQSIEGPIRLLHVATTTDPGSLAYLILGSAAFLTLLGKTNLQLPALFFAATAGVTALILGAPGAEANHLLDLHVAAIVVFCAWLVRQEEGNRQFGLAALAMATLVALVPLLWDLRREVRLPRHSPFEAALQVIGKTDQPILAENPVLPVLAGQRPYVLNAFSLRLLRQRDPSVAGPLWERLRERRFGAVVFITDPHGEVGRTWYASVHFGDGFVQEVEKDYEFVGEVDGQFIYRPRSR
jgi:hypothetical protein